MLASKRKSRQGKGNCEELPGWHAIDTFGIWSRGGAAALGERHLPYSPTWLSWQPAQHLETHLAPAAHLLVWSPVLGPHLASWFWLVYCLPCSDPQRRSSSTLAPPAIWNPSWMAVGPRSGPVIISACCFLTATLDFLSKPIRTSFDYKWQKMNPSLFKLGCIDSLAALSTD